MATAGATIALAAVAVDATTAVAGKLLIARLRAEAAEYAPMVEHETVAAYAMQVRQVERMAR